MPDSPISVKWLNDRERAIAVQRVADFQLGVKNSTSCSLHSSDRLTDAIIDYRSSEMGPGQSPLPSYRLRRPQSDLTLL